MSDINSARLTRTLKRQFERLYAEVPDIAPPPEPKLDGHKVSGWQWEYAQVEWPGRRYARYAGDGADLGDLELHAPRVETVGVALAFVFARAGRDGAVHVELAEASVFDAEAHVTWPDGRTIALGPWRDFFGHLSLDLSSEPVWRGVDLIVGPGFVAEVRGGGLVGLHVEDATMRGYRFKDAPLGAAIFRQVKLEEVGFPGADLTRATFDRCTLQETAFVAADLDTATFDGSTLWGVDLSGASMAGAHLVNVRLIEAVLNDARAVGASFSASSWSRMEVNRADLSAASLEGAQLADVRFVECRFDRATLGSARLEGVVFERCSFVGATMQRATGSDAVWVECDLTDASLDCEQLTATQFIRCTAPPEPTATRPAAPAAEVAIDALGQTQAMVPVTVAPPRPAPPAPEPPPRVVPAPTPPTTVPAPIHLGPPDPIVKVKRRAPFTYALASLLIPGLGQLMLGQTGFGVLLMVVAVFTACGGGLVNVIAAVLAWSEANRRAERG